VYAFEDQSARVESEDSHLAITATTNVESVSKSCITSQPRNSQTRTRVIMADCVVASADGGKSVVVRGVVGVKGSHTSAKKLSTSPTQKQAADQKTWPSTDAHVIAVQDSEFGPDDLARKDRRDSERTAAITIDADVYSPANHPPGVTTCKLIDAPPLDKLRFIPVTLKTLKEAGSANIERYPDVFIDSPGVVVKTAYGEEGEAPLRTKWEKFRAKAASILGRAQPESLEPSLGHDTSDREEEGVAGCFDFFKAMFRGRMRTRRP
jgi:hypothetical protein